MNVGTIETSSNFLEKSALINPAIEKSNEVKIIVLTTIHKL